MEAKNNVLICSFMVRRKDKEHSLAGLCQLPSLFLSLIVSLYRTTPPEKSPGPLIPVPKGDRQKQGEGKGRLGKQRCFWLLSCSSSLNSHVSMEFLQNGGKSLHKIPGPVNFILLLVLYYTTKCANMKTPNHAYRSMS